LNKKGAFQDKGTLTLEPLSVDLQSDWKDIGIRAFQPYFTDKVKMDVTRGTISSTGIFP